MVQSRGDWNEFAGVWGFANWMSLHPCFLCDADKEKMLAKHLLRSASAISLPWTEHCMADYDEARRRCEIVVVNATPDVLRRVAVALDNDRRPDGARGLALM